jgi:hypothetical protein
MAISTNALIQPEGCASFEFCVVSRLTFPNPRCSLPRAAGRAENRIGDGLSVPQELRVYKVIKATQPRSISDENSTGYEPVRAS